MYKQWLVLSDFTNGTESKLLSISQSSAICHLLYNHSVYIA